MHSQISSPQIPAKPRGVIKNMTISVLGWPSKSKDESPILKNISDELDSIVGEAKKILSLVTKYRQVGKLPLQTPSESKTKSHQIVGQERQFQDIKAKLLESELHLKIICVWGVGGIGKTTLAKSIYDDPAIQTHFSTRAWVTISHESIVGEILLKLSDSMDTQIRKGAWDKGGVDHLSAHLHQTLTATRYLIVLDNVWDKELWGKIRNLFPENKKGSRIILTTRKKDDDALYADTFFSMGLMRQSESWTLLTGKVFGSVGDCPFHLVNIGKKIAENCRGLPLLISVVGGLLSKGRKDAEYWRIIEEDTRNTGTEYFHLRELDMRRRDFEYEQEAFGSEDTYLAMLSLSYKHLPAQLKGCFMYMGAFPDHNEIPASKLINLWIAEGFIPPPSTPDTLELVAHRYLEELIDRNLILIHNKGSDGGIKTCGMHDAVRVLARKECQKNNFFHSINMQNRVLAKGAEEVRRISVHKNILMCMEDVHHSAQSHKVVSTLLYAGLDYHHPLPFCLKFELLRVLDALTVYFLEFPNVVVDLIHLRYLGLSFDGKVPPSLSRLVNLQILIIHRHPNFIFIDTSILPVEVWRSMQQMRHLLIPEFDLLPHSAAQNSVLVENLQSLSNVNAAFCTEEIVQNMPNLKKLLFKTCPT